MEVAKLFINNVIVLEAKGSLSANSAPEFTRMIFSIIEAGASRLVIDFSAVSYVTSMGFQHLLMAAQRGNDKNCRIIVCNLRDTVRRLFQLASIDALLPAYESREAAIKSFGHSNCRRHDTLTLPTLIATDSLKRDVTLFENEAKHTSTVLSAASAAPNTNDD